MTQILLHSVIFALHSYTYLSLSLLLFSLQNVVFNVPCLRTLLKKYLLT